jgi:hypothetical protein
MGHTRAVRKSGAVTWSLMAAVAGLVVAPAVPASAAGLRADAGAVVPAGSVVTLPAAGVALKAPADGRLWGYDLTGGVAGVAFTATAGAAANRVSAPPGDQLCVFHLVVDDGADAPFLDPTQLDSAGPTVTVTYGAHQIAVPVDLTASLTSDQVLAVAVPDNADPVVTVTYAGVTASFDLRAGHRVGLDPPGLYRDRQTPWLTDHPAVTGTLTQTGPTPYTATFTDPVTVTGAYLSWFPPTPATTRPPAGDSYLIVTPTGGPPPSVTEGGTYQTAGLPATAVTLTLPDGREAAGRVVNQEAEGNTDLFGGTGAYYFAVPADFTTGTIAIHATAPLAVQNTVGSTVLGPRATLAVTGSVQVPIAFPASSPYRQPVAASPGAGPLPGHPPGSGFPTWAIALLIAAAAVMAGLVVRSRRNPGIPARPVTRPLALTAGPSVWLASGPAILARAEAHARAVVGELPAPPGEPPRSSDSDGQRGDGPDDQGPPQEPAEPVLVVRLLGRLDVEGLTGRLRRKAARRLLVCLCLWPEGPLAGDQLRNALATRDDTEPSTESVRSFATALRAALPAGVFPPAGPAGGYRLVGDIDNDWALFQDLTARAQTLPAGADKLDLISRALRLVRGVPLSGDTWAGVDQAVRHIETTIERTAADGARLALGLHDARTAETLITQGLLAAPASPLLWELRLGAAAAGSGVGLQRAWTQAESALGEDRGMLAATYERLRTGQF